MTSQLQSSEATAATAREQPDEVLFIGNATLLIRYHGLTVLTDPNFIHAGETIDLGGGITTRRLTNPAIDIEDLPPLDGVVLSHLHADHFDRVAEARLDPFVPIVTTPQAADALGSKGFRTLHPVATWETADVIGETATCTVRAMPGKHGPPLVDLALPDVMGSLLEFRDADDESTVGLRVYLSGDTLMYEGIRSIAERESVIDLAFVHLGGTRVMGITVTMDGDAGAELLETLRPRLAVPIHYDDYEAFKSPLDDFRAAVERVGLQDRVRYVERGHRIPL